MTEILTSPLTWMFLSIFCYAIGVAIQQKTGSPLCNPLLIASVLVGVLLIVSGTTYQTYEESGQLISFFLTPATVALAIPIYRKLDVLLHNLLPILLGAFVGSCVSIGSVLLFCHLFGLSDSTTRSLIPKSVTTPIGVALADMMGGVTSITAIAIVITGIFGAILLPTFLKCIGVRNPMQMGLSIGTAAVIGTLGAPYEGIKMPLELPFSPEMINTMLPNDDLDLQVLWLDVAEKYGPDFTSDQLLERFVTHCDYSPGEYAIMRKNWLRGIHAPASGSFCNDYYTEGMGCPIRSEIWACLAPLDPERAADFSERDGVLDHWGESVYAERFFAALEAEAFSVDEQTCDLYALIDAGLAAVPDECRFRELVEDTVALCRRYDDVKLILRKILFRYGHPDCTNMFQNIGITLTALLKGGLDPIKTGMDALNCGFDTDCTCATAGAPSSASSAVRSRSTGRMRGATPASCWACAPSAARTASATLPRTWHGWAVPSTPVCWRALPKSTTTSSVTPRRCRSASSTRTARTGAPMRPSGWTKRAVSPC